MSPLDLFCALFVVVAWGVNFVVIKLGLHGVPPMLLGAFRFALAAVPAVFFVRRPAVSWRWIAAYALTISIGQFALLFSAIAAGMPAGLASLVLQAQAFFTILLARFAFGERLHPIQALGLALAVGGLVAIGLAQGEVAVPPLAFGLTLLAALCWAMGNIVAKRIGRVDALGLVVWASLIPPLPFLALSLLLEGPGRIAAAVANFDGLSAFAVAYLAFVSTLGGYGYWSRLLARYPASQVAPFSLLVPLAGLTSAAAILGERLSPLQVGGIGLVMLGLAVNVLGSRRLRLAMAVATPASTIPTSRLRP